MRNKTDSTAPPATIAERIRHRRRELDLTQGDLADSVGVTQSNVSLWEKGMVTPPTNRLNALAAALEMTVGELLG